MTRTRTLLSTFLAVTALLLGACEEADAVALRMRIRPDFSGTLTASGLVLPAEAHPLAETSEGVQWNDRIGLVCASGDFTDLTALNLDGITFATGVSSRNVTITFVGLISR